MFDKTGNWLIQYPTGKKEKQYAIPASVTDITDMAFAECTGIATIRIGANVSMAVFYEWGPFENDFHGNYNTNGKKAGVYTIPQWRVELHGVEK